MHSQQDRSKPAVWLRIASRRRTLLGLVMERTGKLPDPVALDRTSDAEAQLHTRPAFEPA
ncbi:MAG: hypothetical protein R3236_03510 [Phycisphaeraceae bacterium]|nr:hypothetical protein [Phycisphaeraceae bacterium]